MQRTGKQEPGNLNGKIQTKPETHLGALKDRALAAQRLWNAGHPLTQKVGNQKPKPPQATPSHSKPPKQYLLVITQTQMTQIYRRKSLRDKTPPNPLESIRTKPLTRKQGSPTSRKLRWCLSSNWAQQRLGSREPGAGVTDSLAWMWAHVLQ